MIISRHKDIENKNKGLPMIKELSRAILVCGILLLILGVNAHDFSGSDISRLFSGSAADKSTWMLAGGAAAAVLGLAG